jgi:hypothetical protein
VAVPEQLSGTKNGWRFHIPVLLGIATGILLIVAAEMLSRSHAISTNAHDAGLVVGGALLGLIALTLDELYRTGPERERMRRERAAERTRHQDERRLDFEQYRALQAELCETRTHTATLEAKLNLTGALDRDRIGDALLLGFYFHRRGEGLPSSPNQSVFKTAAKRLKLLTENGTDVKLDKQTLHDVLQIAYGSVVAEGFDLGYVLSHLGEALKLDGRPSTEPSTNGASSNIKKLAARVASIVRQL